MRQLTGLLPEIGPRMRDQARRLPPLPWRTRRGAALSIVVAMIVVAGVGGWIWRQGWPKQAAAALGEAVAGTTAGLGLAVDEVFVIGRQHAERADLRAALAIERGDPILFIDLEAARSRVTELSWVADASVERLLPNIIVVRLDERAPLALWQLQGNFSVIDAEGYVLARDAVSRYGHLPLVVGDQAPEAAADFVRMIATEPWLAGQVKAGVRVSGRRWDVHLDSGTQVRLPAEGARDAWARLADYQIAHRILENSPDVVDLRIQGRVTIVPAEPLEENDPGAERSV